MSWSPAVAGAAVPAISVSNATPDPGENVWVTDASTVSAPPEVFQVMSNRTSTLCPMFSPSPTRCQVPAGIGPRSLNGAWLDSPSPIGTPQNGAGGPSGMSWRTLSEPPTPASHNIDGLTPGAASGRGRASGSAGLSALQAVITIR